MGHLLFFFLALALQIVYLYQVTESHGTSTHCGSGEGDGRKALCSYLGPGSACVSLTRFGGWKESRQCDACAPNQGTSELCMFPMVTKVVAGHV